MQLFGTVGADLLSRFEHWNETLSDQVSFAAD